MSVCLAIFLFLETYHDVRFAKAPNRRKCTRLNRGTKLDLSLWAFTNLNRTLTSLPFFFLAQFFQVCPPWVRLNRVFQNVVIFTISKMPFGFYGSKSLTYYSFLPPYFLYKTGFFCVVPPFCLWHPRRAPRNLKPSGAAASFQWHLPEQSLELLYGESRFNLLQLEMTMLTTFDCSGAGIGGLTLAGIRVPYACASTFFKKKIFLFIRNKK